VKGSFFSLTVALAAALVAAAVAVAAQPKRDFSLHPVGITSRVAGDATLNSLGRETGIQVVLTGLPKGKKFRLVLTRGTCARRSAKVTLLGIASADKRGIANYASLVRDNGAPINFASIVDGKHVITVVVAKKTLACGSIPA
jgi:hypothetical protein